SCAATPARFIVPQVVACVRKKSAAPALVKRCSPVVDAHHPANPNLTFGRAAPLTTQGHLNDCGGPMRGVFSGAAAPIAITTAFPPGFTAGLPSIFQLFVSHTLPDRSICPPVIRSSESL